MLLTYFAAEAGHQAENAAQSAGGLSALGLNWQAFLFQLITFLIVLLILRQFVFKKLVAVLEQRRKAVEDSLKHAAETEQKLRSAEQKISTMLGEARSQADNIVNAGHKEAAQVIEVAEEKAEQRAQRIVQEAKAQMQAEATRVRLELKAETAQLVAAATEQIIKEKLDTKKDAELIERALAKGRS